MKIEVVSTIDEIKLEDIKRKTVIVIDVLRTSSTITTALAHGANEVIPVQTLGQARSYREEHHLLAGERYAKKIPGFPFNNSPSELTTASLHEKSLVLTTTNGTRAIQKASKASHVLIGSFLNAIACAELAVQLRKDVTILCTGSRQEFSLEDGLCAGYIGSLISEQVPDSSLNDLGQALCAAASHLQFDLSNAMYTTESGKRLFAAGHEADLLFCAQKNIYSFVPTLQGQSIVIFTPDA